MLELGIRAIDPQTLATWAPVLHELLENEPFHEGSAHLAEEIGDHFSGEESCERGARLEGFLELIQVGEEGFFGFSGEENVVCELGGIRYLSSWE